MSFSTAGEVRSICGIVALLQLVVVADSGRRQRHTVDQALVKLVEVERDCCWNSTLKVVLAFCLLGKQWLRMPIVLIHDTLWLWRSTRRILRNSERVREKSRIELASQFFLSLWMKVHDNSL